MWFCGGVHRVCPHAERTVFRDGVLIDANHAKAEEAMVYD